MASFDGINNFKVAGGLGPAAVANAAAMTASALTVADGAGTNDNTIGAITGDASVIAAVQEIADEINKLVADVTEVRTQLNAALASLRTAQLLPAA